MSEPALEPLRRSTRNTLLFTEVIALLPFGFLLQERPGWLPVILMAAGVGVLTVIRVRGILQALRGPWQPFSYSRVYGLTALGLALACVAATAKAQSGGFATIFVGMAAAEFFVARPFGVAWRHVGYVLVGQTAALAAVIVLTGQQDFLRPVLLAALLMTVALAFGIGVTYRQWEGALKLEEARKDAADLAATRERLRLAEDLHDILGHALEVVSLKSELAVRLTDPERAKAEMVEVQRLARNALRDVRTLAHANRPTDFATELAGARSLLDSAGISCDFTADPAALTAAERDLFGRVLREAMTNALRHADARSCCVSLETMPDQAVLRVMNDGVAPLRSGGDGSGLASLARRVKAAGGSFHAGNVEPASFEVIASLPR